MADEPTPSELADADVRDELPQDLDAAGYVGPYVFPNNNRRRIPGYLYLAWRPPSSRPGRRPAGATGCW